MTSLLSLYTAHGSLSTLTYEGYKTYVSHALKNKGLRKKSVKVLSVGFGGLASISSFYTIIHAIGSGSLTPSEKKIFKVTSSLASVMMMTTDLILSKKKNVTQGANDAPDD